jgi:hypothetical protein
MTSHIFSSFEELNCPLFATVFAVSISLKRKSKTTHNMGMVQAGQDIEISANKQDF